MDIKVTKNDLNGQEQIMGKGQISAKGGVVVDDTGNKLKGALADYNGSLSIQNELQYIKGVKKQIFEYEVERFQYENLPDGIDKYRLETKTIQNGSSAIVKFASKYWVVNYSIITFNMYNEPRVIKVLEPKSNILNGLEFDVVSDDAIIYRNNKDRISNYIQAYRFITTMEKTLYQIEKNIVSSAPKGLINLKGAEFDEEGENPMQDSMEKVINGQNTFFTIRSKDIAKQSVGDDNSEKIFIPIEFTDRTKSLIENYTFLKEQIKEIIGAMSNQMQNKKERLVSGEVDVQQPLANATRQHSFNIRQIDIAKINERFGTNITLEYQSDERDEIEEDDDE